MANTDPSTGVLRRLGGGIYLLDSRTAILRIRECWWCVATLIDQTEFLGGGASRGSVVWRVWTDAPAHFIEAPDLESLRALVRPFPAIPFAPPRIYPTRTEAIRGVELGRALIRGVR